MAVISGTKDAKTLSVVTGTKDAFNFRGSSEVRKLRCKQCGEQALPAPDGKGEMQMQCPNCGTIYKSTAL